MMDVVGNDLRLGVGGVFELHRVRDVAQCPDAIDPGSLVLIDDDIPGGVELDACFGHAQLLAVGDAAGGDQQLVGHDRIAGGELDDDFVAVLVDVGWHFATSQIEPLAEYLGETLGYSRRSWVRRSSWLRLMMATRGSRPPERRGPSRTR